MTYKITILTAIIVTLLPLCALETPSHDFEKNIKPILDKYCIRCHGTRKQKGDVRLDTLDPDIINGPDAEAWHATLDVINTADMPPEDVKQPNDEQRRQLVDWMTTNLKIAKEKKRGKQNNIMRRLTKEQYNHAVSELLGISIDFSKPLPPETLSHMGFSNAGETLNISPLHIEYYQKIAREALTQAIGPKSKPPINRYKLEFGKEISHKIYARATGYQSVNLSATNYHTHIYDRENNILDESATAPSGIKVIDLKKSLMVDFRGSSQQRFGMTDDGVVMYSALPHKEIAPQSWRGPNPNLKMLIHKHFPTTGDFILRVKAEQSDYFELPENQLMNCSKQKNHLRIAPLAIVKQNKLKLPTQSIVITAKETTHRRLLEFKNNSLHTTDRGNVAEASFILNIPKEAYYQVDIIHLQPLLPDQLKISLDTQTVKIHVKDNKSQKLQATPLAFAKLQKGKHTLKVSGKNFLAFQQIIFTPLEDKHSVAQNNEQLLKTIAHNKRKYKDSTPSLQVFLGTRSDDGMDHKNFSLPKIINALPGKAKTYEFKGRLENLPVPVIDHNTNNPLANIMILGVYNSNLVKSNQDYGSAVKIKSIEFEAPYFKTWPTTSYKKIFFDSPNKNDRDKYTKEILKRFINQAFRQPVSQQIIDRYYNFWTSIRSNYKRYENGVKETLVAVLCSPTFLYINETPDAQNAYISDMQLASRLSFFLWNTPPDNQLLRLAFKGELHTNLNSQIKRMIQDSKSINFIKSFGKEWLRMERLHNISTDVNKYSDYTRFVKRDMEEETYQFLYYMLNNNLSILNFIDSDFVMLNQNLAEFYNIKNVTGNHFRPIKIDKKQDRGGLISQGSFLTGHSDGQQAHPIKRAVWIMSKFLDDEPPPPPPNVPALEQQSGNDKKRTIKQQLEDHREEQSCKDCHLKIDPWGVAFENYDAVGRLLPTADAKTELLDGTKIDGIKELKAYILKNKKQDLNRSVVKHLLAYALGRSLSYMDNEDINHIVKQTEQQKYGFQSLITNIIKHEIFRRR